MHRSDAPILREESDLNNPLLFGPSALDQVLGNARALGILAEAIVVPVLSLVGTGSAGVVLLGFRAG